ncbi:hypothetical protein [Bacillus sp. JJ722]|uniref:hypothetical protein n=1 Tax=Bacillus sp. JJ722 TaxID=3122973 RepID=UPI002FFD611C
MKKYYNVTAYFLFILSVALAFIMFSDVRLQQPFGAIAVWTMLISPPLGIIFSLIGSKGMRKWIALLLNMSTLPLAALSYFAIFLEFAP